MIFFLVFRISFVSWYLATSTNRFSINAMIFVFSRTQFLSTLFYEMHASCSFTWEKGGVAYNPQISENKSWPICQHSWTRRIIWIVKIPKKNVAIWLLLVLATAIIKHMTISILWLSMLFNMYTGENQPNNVTLFFIIVERDACVVLVLHAWLWSD